MLKVMGVVKTFKGVLIPCKERIKDVELTSEYLVHEHLDVVGGKRLW